MRHYLKAIVITSTALYAAITFIPTIHFGRDPKNILFTLGGLFLISQVINPIFSLILLPLNHLTFGLVMFLFNIALIFALINFLPGFNVNPYHFPGTTIEGLILPATSLNRVATIILVAFVITFVQKVLHIIFE